MKTYIYYAAIGFTLWLSACKNKSIQSDASGTFECTEVILSSEVSGQILQWQKPEGDSVQIGDIIGKIDSTQLYLKKLQLEAQLHSLEAKQPQIPVQLAALKVQWKAALNDQKRLHNLLTSGAASQKQCDDIDAQTLVLQNQIKAMESTLGINSESLRKEYEPIRLQIAQTEDLLHKCSIVAPMNATILVQYVEANEWTAPGKALVKLGDVSHMVLRAYITGDQLSKVRLNQSVHVWIDNGNKEQQEIGGTITWISNQAEFTPKTIQTRDERANLVYAIKVAVDNKGGFIKNGMYGEITF